jgi:iron complex outermembrane receptor protein
MWERASARRFGFIAASLLVTGTPGVAFALDELEEVTVTAERRVVDLQKTALAITVIPASSLDKSNINDLAGLNGEVPGLEITRSSGFETVVTLRGVGSETPENAPTTVPGVAFFVDGVYIANTISLDQTLFDVDHLEVLRGPQGALYGESAIGGAITLVTKQPELGKFDASGDLTGGTYDLFRGRVETNLPVGDTVAVRFSAQKYEHEGFSRDPLLPPNRLDDAHDASEKVAVLWKPTDHFSATFTAQWYESNTHGAAQKNIHDPDPDPRAVTQDYPGKFDLRTQLFHLNLEYDSPWFAVKSVTAYQGLDHVQQEDSSRSAISVIHAYDDVAAWNTNLQNYTEEFDLLSLPNSRLDWIGGVFLLKQTSGQFVVEFENPSTTNPNPDLTILPNIESAPPGNLSYGNDSNVTRKSYAPFLQGMLHVTDALRASAGVRFNHDSYVLDSFNFSAFAIDDVVHRYTDNQTTGRAEIEYDLEPTSLVYGSVARGYKPGGVNGIATAVVVPNTFQLETNTAFEVGSKNTFFDKTLRVNAAGFFYIYRNMQYIETDPFPFDGGMANIPRAHAWGAEFESAWLGFENHLQVGANLTLEDSRIEGHYKTIDSTVQNAIENGTGPCAYGGQFYNPACWNAVIAAARDVGGNPLPKMPNVLGSVNVAYGFDLPVGKITPRVEYVYRGSEWARIFAQPALDHIGGYGVCNLNLTYQPPNPHFSLALTATNVGNVLGVNSRYTDPYGTFTTSQQFIAPRQVLGTVAFSY